MSEVYDTITLEHLQHLTRFVDFSRVESVLTSTLQDPVGSCLFKTTVKFDFTSNVLVFSRRGLDSDTVREQLSGLSRSLESMVEQLHPGTAAEVCFSSCLFPLWMVGDYFSYFGLVSFWGLP